MNRLKLTLGRKPAFERDTVGSPENLTQRGTPAGPLAGMPRKIRTPKLDSHHAFPDIVDNYAGIRQEKTIETRGPGGKVVRFSRFFQTLGSLTFYKKNGRKNRKVTHIGVFEWIVDRNQVTHRRFIPGGGITDFPNQRVKKGSHVD